VRSSPEHLKALLARWDFRLNAMVPLAVSGYSVIEAIFV
jgi:hypothetical protein